MWFHWKASPLNIKRVKIENTERDITSWMTLSWTRENGPPFSIKPMRFAGTWKAYSANAISHEKTMMPHKGQLSMSFICWSFRCPYQAKVINTLDTISSRIV